MKAVVGAAELAAGTAGAVVDPGMDALWIGLMISGGSQLLEEAAQSLEGTQGNFSMRQAAAPAQAIYGFQRVAGTIVWVSTSGSNKDYLHLIVVWAMHPCESIESLWVDGKQVFFDGQGGEGPLDGDNAVLNQLGQVVSGNAVNQTYKDMNGNNYNWDGHVSMYNHLGGNTNTNPFTAFLGPNDPNYPSDYYFNGITASYIQLTYSSNMFNGGISNIRASIRGKNDIYDPRSKTTGYTQNMALCIANVLTDKEVGVGCDYASEIDEPQLIAAANACDEQVNLAAGGTEARYECNGSFQCTSSPGDIIQSMLDSCAGRLTYTGGMYGIYPGIWQGVTDQSIMPENVIDAPTFTPTRKYRDLVNMCTGTFISPIYPWASGYSYDYQDPVMQVFQGEWQPTNFPYWSNDTMHGYPASASYITADQGRTLTKDIKLQFVVSASCAQRIAKIQRDAEQVPGLGKVQV